MEISDKQLNYKNEFTLSRENQNIIDNIVFIDGFSGSGKSLIASLFGYLQKTEKWQLDSKYEYVAILYYLDKINIDTAKTMLHLIADNHIYDLMLSRNVNFRTSDQSSPHYDGLEEKYLKRLSKMDGDKVVEDIKFNKYILPIHVHYIFGNSDILFSSYKAKLKLYLMVLRNPFDLIKAWHEGNWVNRIANDNRDYHICVQKDNNIVPWYTIDYYEEYISANDMEKAILTIYYYYKKVFTQYNNLSVINKNKTLFIVFENFIINPDRHIDKICNILNIKRDVDFSKIMERLNLPRNNKTEELSLSKFTKQYFDTIDKKYLDLLSILEEEYNNFIKKVSL